jgi:hypothetical protein
MIRQHQLIGGATALAAALMVSAAPAARGDPAPLAKAEAEIAGAFPSAGSGVPWASIPKPDRIAAERAAANKSASLDRFALIHVRALPQTATVHPNADEQTPVAAARGAGPPAEIIGRGGRGFSDTPATIVRVTTPSGFDWGDAGVGAAGALGLAMLTGAGALVITQRRTRRTTRSPGAIS